jgi:Xaa-Pro dipeptidase
VEELNNEPLLRARQERLRAVMRSAGVPVLLTSDPINILYGCGVRNMTVFGMMGPSRFLLLFADGPSVLFEFAGCEHLAAGFSTVSEVRPAPGITANSGPPYRDGIAAFAAEITDECVRVLGRDVHLAVERVDFEFTDALRNAGARLVDATAIFLEARRIKQKPEIAMMREAVHRVESGVASVERAIRAGVSEVEVWAAFHHDLIATEGEYVSTRLLQGGPNTFPYFREAGHRRLVDGDLVCIDTDAIGYGGYAVDFSRTFLCGDAYPSLIQKQLYTQAFDQLQHNAALLSPGRSYAEFARKAWVLQPEHRPYGYYCLMHGLGLCGEHPYVPLHNDGVPYPMSGELEPGMVVCLESYIGDSTSAQGVKLEDQFLITDTGAERLTTYPFSESLLTA